MTDCLFLMISARYVDNVTIMLVTEIVLLIYAFRKFNNDFFSPSVLTLIFYVVSVGCYLWNISLWNFHFTWKAYLLFTITFVMMILIESHHRNYAISNYQPHGYYDDYLYIRHPWDIILFGVFISFSVLYVYKVYKSGMALGASSFLMAIGFNKEEGDFDGMSRLFYNVTRMASYVYMVMFAQNVIVCRDKWSNNIYSIIIIIVMVFNTFFSGQRSALIAYVISFILAINIAIKNIKDERRFVLERRFFKILVTSAVAFLIFFFISANAVKGTEKDRVFIDYVTYYFGCTTASMGEIVEKPSSCHTPFHGYFGEKTFMGVWQALHGAGFVKHEPCDRQWMNMGNPYEPYQATNEYTFFCAPYIDFGFVGTLLFMFVFFWLFNYFYYRRILYNDYFDKYVIKANYIFFYTLVAMSFYQDTIRSYSRPVNLLYVIFIVVFFRFCVERVGVKPQDGTNPNICK